MARSVRFLALSLNADNRRSKCPTKARSRAECAGRALRDIKHPDWLQQVWFAGNHSGVGGSYTGNEARLSGISLGWMTHAAENFPDRKAPSRFGIIAASRRSVLSRSPAFIGIGGHHDAVVPPVPSVVDAGHIRRDRLRSKTYLPVILAKLLRQLVDLIGAIGDALQVTNFPAAHPFGHRNRNRRLVHIQPTKMLSFIRPAAHACGSAPDHPA
ncbi:phospholipase effector Tle1 domain-containing protein [Bradyrhizobium elkanii]|uniref:phospholipase effector Tle1 domain-containing protein n=1 Tax=Bradyrhizobium elkanii TaxID=29448 RepID=UPI0009C1A279